MVPAGLRTHLKINGWFVFKDSEDGLRAVTATSLYNPNLQLIVITDRNSSTLAYFKKPEPIMYFFMQFSFSQRSQGLSALSQFNPFTAAVQHEPAGKHRCSDLHYYWLGSSIVHNSTQCHTSWKTLVYQQMKVQIACLVSNVNPAGLTAFYPKALL